MNQKIRTLLNGLLILFIGLGVGCSSFLEMPLENNELKGTLALNVKFKDSSNSVFATQSLSDIYEVFVTCTRDNTVITKNIMVTGNRVISSKISLGIGHWDVAIEAKNDSGRRLYSNSTDVWITIGETTPATLVLNPDTGRLNLQINDVPEGYSQLSIILSSPGLPDITRQLPIVHSWFSTSFELGTGLWNVSANISSNELGIRNAAPISVQIDKNASATKAVYFDFIPTPESITITPSTLSLMVSEEYSLEATILPANSIQDIDWETSNSDVVSFTDDGVILATGVGMAIIRARSSADASKVGECVVEVTAAEGQLSVNLDLSRPDVQSLTLNKETLNMVMGESATLTAIVSPVSANAAIRWESLNEVIASVDQSGLISANNLGTTIIIAVSEDDENVMAQCTINVVQPTDDMVYELSHQWGSFGGAEKYISLVVGGPNNYLYGVDLANNKIVVLDMDLNLINSWGSVGSGQGEFLGPEAVTVDDTGNVYVADAGNFRIQKFDSDGSFLTTWECPRDNSSEYQHLNDIDINASGNLLVSVSTDSILEYTAEGVLIRTITLNDVVAASIEIDSSNNIIILNRNNSQINVYNSSFELIHNWTFASESRSLIKQLNLDHNDNIVLLEGYSSTMRIYSLSGELISEKQLSGMSFDVAFCSDGGFFTGNFANGTISKFYASGALQDDWYLNNDYHGQFLAPEGLATDYQGNVYVVDRGNSTIQKFDSSGNFLMEIGGLGQEAGKFLGPRYIALDSQGNIYVTDDMNFRIQKFSPNGTFLLQWGSEGIGVGQFSSFRDIAIDSEDNIYVLEDYRVQKFDSSGNHLVNWREWGNSYYGISNPSGIEVDSSGYVYLLQSWTRTLHKFDKTGMFQEEIELNYGNGPYAYPHQFVISSSGIIVALDDSEEGVSRFDAHGNLLSHPVSLGRDSHRWNITLGNNGVIYIPNPMEHQIEAYSPIN